MARAQPCTCTPAAAALHCSGALQEQQHHMQQTQLLQLPAVVLQHVLSYVPLQQRLGSCSVVSRSMHTAAVAATEEVKIYGPKSQQTADVLCDWLRKHSNRALRHLDLNGGGIFDFADPYSNAQQIAVSLPWRQLAKLRSLRVVCVELPAAASSAANQAGGAAAAASSAMPAGGVAADDAGVSTAAAAAAASMAALTALTSLELSDYNITSTNRTSSSSSSQILGSNSYSNDLQQSSCAITVMQWTANELVLLTGLRRLDLFGGMFDDVELHPISFTYTDKSAMRAECSKAVALILAQLTQLTRMNLWGISLDGTAFAGAGSHSQLQELSVSHANSNNVPWSIQNLPPCLTKFKATMVCFSCPVLSDSCEWQLSALQTLCLEAVEGFQPAVLTLMPQLQHFTFATHHRVLDAAALLAALPQLLQLQHIEVAYRLGVQHAAASSFAALTASSHVTALTLQDCILPADAAQHMFPAGVQLQQLLQLLQLQVFPCCGRLQSLKASMPGIFQAQNDFVKRYCLALSSSSAVPWLVSCCPNLCELSTVWLDSSSSSRDLQSLLQLTGLTKLGIAGSGWDDSAAEAVLARMLGG
jgi:Leucine-rich repeat (LRR) protein